MGILVHAGLPGGPPAKSSLLPYPQVCSWEKGRFDRARGRGDEIWSWEESPESQEPYRSHQTGEFFSNVVGDRLAPLHLLYRSTEIWASSPVKMRP